jgi:predicted nucleic acid-binding protein
MKRMKDKLFADTNVILYLLSQDTQKADQAEAVLNQGVIISVQVLNETTQVLRKKIKLSWPETHAFLSLIKSLCSVQALTLETHTQGLKLAERYQFSVYDAMIVSAALLAECRVLYSEDMQHDLLVEGQLRICNPFLAKH